MFRARLLAMLAACSLCGLAGAAALPDPTQPPGGQAGVAPRPSAPRYVLSSVLIGADRRAAVINGRTVTEGETVNGARVLAVSPAGVRLQRDGREFTVELLPRGIKRRSDQP